MHIKIITKHFKNFIFINFVIICLLLISSTKTIANEPIDNDGKTKSVKNTLNINKNKFDSNPTKIRSEKITITRKNQLIEFSDNVIVEKEDSSLLADRMIVIYEENKSNGIDNKSTKIKKIEAFDHVKIFTDDSTATGDTGYFDPNENIFVLEKNVMVNNGTSIASGEKFIYNLTSKKGYFIGKQNQTNKQKDQDDRVTVIITDSVKDLKKTKTNHDQKNSQSK